MPPNNFVKPRYESTCFANIPQTIHYLLTGQGQPALPPEVFGDLPQRYQSVVLFFVDGFGWRFFERYADHYPALQRFIKQGAVSQLTSQFPSTTAAHVTAIHTGLPPNQSGIYEWQYYEPQLDALISPLLFSFSGTMQRDTLAPTGIDPALLYPTRTIYQDWQRDGISATLFQHRGLANTPYSRAVNRGAKIAPIRTLSEALTNIAQHLETSGGPSYTYFYFSDIDGMGHYYGVNSPQFEAEVDAFLTALDRLFFQRLQGRLQDTLFIMTADHGQVEVDPQTVIYLNQDERFSGVERFFKRNSQGDLLVPGGSARDMFLYIRDELLDEAQQFIAEPLAGKAEVHKVADLIDQGYFGPGPSSAAFLSRVGDLVILPYAGESVWWYDKGRYEMFFYGHHGGLTRQEMEIPLLLYPFSN